MKHAKLLLFTGIILVCSSFAVAKWVTIANKEGRFTAQFPGKPEESRKPSNTPAGPITINLFSYNADLSKYGNRLYLLMYADYPEKVINSSKMMNVIDTFFKNAIDGAVNNIHGKIIFTQNSPLGKYPGRFVKASFGEGKAFMDVHFYLVGNRFYMLEVGYQKGLLNAASEKLYFNSFKLLNN